MLTIRLSRQGTTKKPRYRVVLMEKSGARNGRALEILGTYNPVPNPAVLELERERIQYWIDHGAQTSGTVRHLLRRAGERAPAAAPAAES